MNELQRLARQLPVHKLRMTPWDYVRHLPKAIATALWERGKLTVKTDPNEKYLFTCPSCKNVRSFKMFGEQVYREHGICLGCFWIE